MIYFCDISNSLGAWLNGFQSYFKDPIIVGLDQSASPIKTVPEEEEKQQAEEFTKQISTFLKKLKKKLKKKLQKRQTNPINI